MKGKNNNSGFNNYNNVICFMFLYKDFVGLYFCDVIEYRKNL